jgi:hypothetical protein
MWLNYAVMLQGLCFDSAACLLNNAESLAVLPLIAQRNEITRIDIA